MNCKNSELESVVKSVVSTQEFVLLLGITAA